MCWVQSAAIGVDVVAVGSDVEERNLGGAGGVEAAEELGSDGCSGTVGAVGHDFQAVEFEAGDGVDEELNVVGLEAGLSLMGRFDVGSGG